MPAPKLPALFSLFRQRQLKGFDYTPRYYDPQEEARRERLARLGGEGAAAREELRQRIRHSWHREGSARGSSMRLVVLLGLFAALAFAAMRLLRLLGPAAPWGI